jgi:hypothetical protein
MIDSYDKLTLGIYRELLAIEKTEDDVSYGIKILSALSDYSEDELMDMPMDEFQSLMAKTSFLNTPMQKLDWKHLGKTITINGKKYNIIKDARKMTAGQYIDYKSYMKDADKFIEMLPYILTVFIIPEGCKYNDGYDIEDLAKELNDNLDLKTALSITDFFQHQSKLSMLTSLRYLKWMMKRMMKTEKNLEVRAEMENAMNQMALLENLIKNGDGYTQQ